MPSSGRTAGGTEGRAEGRDVGRHRSLGRTNGGRAHASLPAGGPARTRSGRVRHPRDVPRRVLLVVLPAQGGPVAVRALAHRVDRLRHRAASVARRASRVRADARGGGAGSGRRVAGGSRRVHQGAPRRGRRGGRPVGRGVPAAAGLRRGVRAHDRRPRPSRCAARTVDPRPPERHVRRARVRCPRRGHPGRRRPELRRLQVDRGLPDRLGRRRPERGRGTGGVLELARRRVARDAGTTRNRSATS